MSTKRQSHPTPRPKSRQRSFSKSRPSRPSSHQSYRQPSYEQPSIVIESSNEENHDSDIPIESEGDESEDEQLQEEKTTRMREKRRRRHDKGQQEDYIVEGNFSKPTSSLEAHTFACPCGGTLKACWPENLDLSRLVAAKIPVFGEINKVNELADSLAALPFQLHYKLTAYCLNGNSDVQAELMNVLAEMDYKELRDYDSDDAQTQKILRNKVEERLRNAATREPQYIFALLAVSMAKGKTVCELPSFTVILARVYQ